VKSGTKFEPGEEYQGVIKEGFGVTFVVASETGRLVLRLIICDSNGCLDKDKMDGEYAKQYE